MYTWPDTPKRPAWNGGYFFVRHGGVGFSWLDKDNTMWTDNKALAIYEELNSEHETWYCYWCGYRQYISSTVSLGNCVRCKKNKFVIDKPNTIDSGNGRFYNMTNVLKKWTDSQINGIPILDKTAFELEYTDSAIDFAAKYRWPDPGTIKGISHLHAIEKSNDLLSWPQPPWPDGWFEIGDFGLYFKWNRGSRFYTHGCGESTIKLLPDNWWCAHCKCSMTIRRTIQLGKCPDCGERDCFVMTRRNPPAGYVYSNLPEFKWIDQDIKSKESSMSEIPKYLEEKNYLFTVLLMAGHMDRKLHEAGIKEYNLLPSKESPGGMGAYQIKDILSVIKKLAPEGTGWADPILKGFNREYMKNQKKHILYYKELIKGCLLFFEAAEDLIDKETAE